MNDITSRFHSVILDEGSCKGCTICITTCPVEAIRVRGGKAHIIEEKCIDCGECIRRCPSHAKKARADDILLLKNYAYTVALPAPSLYAQFSEKYSIGRIRQALRNIGFSEVYDVAAAAHLVSQETAQYLSRTDIPRPVISSSCPVVIKLIQIRFPTLPEHLLPVLPPVEAAARIVRNREHGAEAGIFFISPCASKITAARSPLGYEKSEIDGVFSIADLYIPLLNALRVTAETEEAPQAESEGYGWGCATGEIKSLSAASDKEFRWISADGIDQVTRTLEAIEDGKLASIDYAELSACVNGCVGGPLTVTLPPLASAVMRERKTEAMRGRACEGTGSVPQKIAETPLGAVQMDWTVELASRPALLLHPDYEKARAMMEEMEALYAELPGLDCGSCGAPNCHALAEDIVRGNAAREDCILVLREQYEKLILKKNVKK